MVYSFYSRKEEDGMPKNEIVVTARSLVRFINAANKRALTHEEKEAISNLKVALADKARDDESAHR